MRGQATPILSIGCQRRFPALLIGNTAVLSTTSSVQDSVSGETGMLIAVLYIAVLGAPTLASAQRVHDTGRPDRSLVGFPGLGWAAKIFTMLAEQGSPRVNEFGRPHDSIRIMLAPQRPEHLRDHHHRRYKTNKDHKPRILTSSRAARIGEKLLVGSPGYCGELWLIRSNFRNRPTIVFKPSLRT
jgi:hypothetical protein